MIMIFAIMSSPNLDLISVNLIQANLHIKWNASKKERPIHKLSSIYCQLFICLFLAFAQRKLNWHLAFNNTVEHRCLENRGEHWDSMTKI